MRRRSLSNVERPVMTRQLESCAEEDSDSDEDSRTTMNKGEDRVLHRASEPNKSTGQQKEESRKRSWSQKKYEDRRAPRTVLHHKHSRDALHHIAMLRNFVSGHPQSKPRVHDSEDDSKHADSEHRLATEVEHSSHEFVVDERHNADDVIAEPQIKKHSKHSVPSLGKMLKQMRIRHHSQHGPDPSKMPIDYSYSYLPETHDRPRGSFNTDKSSSTSDTDAYTDNESKGYHRQLFAFDNESGVMDSSEVIDQLRASETDKYIIFRNSSDDQSIAPQEILQEMNALEDKRGLLALFMDCHTCYDLIPTSAKLVVFDTELSVKKAFYALVSNGVRAAILWDNTSHRFVGMLTVTDFITILQKYYRSSMVPMDEFENHRIATWRRELDHTDQPLWWISPEATLYDAITCLVHSRIHRLPVIDPATGNLLHIVTHKRILKFMCLFMRQMPMPPFMSETLQDLHIGTFDNVFTVNETTPLIDVMRMFVSNHISAVPIVGENGVLMDVFSKFDVIHLAATRTYNNLEITVTQALKHRAVSLTTCSLQDTLSDVVETIVVAEVHRLIVCDDSKRVIGIVSLSDLLRFLILKWDRPTRSIPIRETTKPCKPEGRHKLSV